MDSFISLSSIMEIIVQTKQCKSCGITFHITDKDMEFYDKISPIFGRPLEKGGLPAGRQEGGIKKYKIPTPTLCPDCRQQRRASFRNERNLYKINCDNDHKQVISIYNPQKKHIIYDQSFWRSDGRNPEKYGFHYDFNKSFFEQFSILFLNTPRISLNSHNSNENSEYVNYIVQSKNCYLCFGGGYNENIGYASLGFKMDNSYELYFCKDSTNCYEITFCNNCFEVFYGKTSQGCNRCIFIEDCFNCKDCVYCCNLTNAQYCILNKQYTKEEYYKKRTEIEEDLKNNLKECKKTFENFSFERPKKYAHIYNSEYCNGDYIQHSKNCKHTFVCEGAEDVMYSTEILNGIKDVADSFSCGAGLEKGYEIIVASMNAYGIYFSSTIRNGSSNILYSSDLSGCSNCFGCVGLRNKEYCILNKQYTKKEYEVLVPQIIEQMIEDGERGEFFPASLSPFGYNETVAMEYFPLTKEEALAKGFNRSDYESPFPQVDKILKANELPNIQEVTNEILKQAIECEITKKPFRIIKPELEFYRKHNLPLPTKHPDQRHKERMALRNPRKLRDRNCMKCGIDIKTSYNPEREEIVYCEQCYSKEIYG